MTTIKVDTGNKETSFEYESDVAPRIGEKIVGPDGTTWHVLQQPEHRIRLLERVTPHPYYIQSEVFLIVSTL